MTDDERAIRKLVDDWLKASKTGDQKTILSLMADDVVFMVPGREPFGKEAFQNASGEQQKVDLEGSSDIKEVQVFDDWAYLRTHLSITETPRAGGKPRRRSGYTLSILRRTSEGKWVLARDANLLVADS